MFSRQTSRHGSVQLSIAIGALLTGASLMYLFDPRAGRRRRALLSGQVNRGLRQSREFAQKVRTDAQNRARGLYEQSRSALQGVALNDETLAERARAALGRLCSHPGALEVTCTDRIIHLSGDILSNDVKQVLHGVRNVRGVKNVVNELRVHESAANIPALQGESNPRATALPEYLQDHWSPHPESWPARSASACLQAASAHGVSVRAPPPWAWPARRFCYAQSAIVRWLDCWAWKPIPKTAP